MDEYTKHKNSSFLFDFHSQNNCGYTTSLIKIINDKNNNKNKYIKFLNHIKFRTFLILVLDYSFTNNKVKDFFDDVHSDLKYLKIEFDHINSSNEYIKYLPRTLDTLYLIGYRQKSIYPCVNDFNNLCCNLQHFTIERSGSKYVSQTLYFPHKLFNYLPSKLYSVHFSFSNVDTKYNNDCTKNFPNSLKNIKGLLWGKSIPYNLLYLDTCRDLTIFFKKKNNLKMLSYKSRASIKYNFTVYNALDVFEGLHSSNSNVLMPYNAKKVILHCKFEHATIIKKKVRIQISNKVEELVLHIDEMQPSVAERVSGRSLKPRITELPEKINSLTIITSQNYCTLEDYNKYFNDIFIFPKEIKNLKIPRNSNFNKYFAMTQQKNNIIVEKFLYN
jgi:hypothetical protein